MAHTLLPAMLGLQFHLVGALINESQLIRTLTPRVLGLAGAASGRHDSFKLLGEAGCPRRTRGWAREMLPTAITDPSCPPAVAPACSG